MLTNKNKKFLIDFGPKEHYDSVGTSHQIKSQSFHRKADFDRHLNFVNSIEGPTRHELMDHLASSASNDAQRELLLDLNHDRDFQSKLPIIADIAKSCGNHLMKKLLNRYGDDMKEWCGYEVYNNKTAKDVVVDHLNSLNQNHRMNFSLDATSSKIPEVRIAAARHVGIHIEDDNLMPYNHDRIKESHEFANKLGYPELHDKLKSIGYIDENEHRS